MNRISRNVKYKPKRNLYFLIAVFVVLTPLLYSSDWDPYREWKVAGLAALCVIGSMTLRFNARIGGDHLFLFGYCIVLISQTFYLENVSLWFGFQYAVLMIAAFVPAWFLMGINLSPDVLEKALDVSLKLLAIVLVLNIVGSRFFSFGETYLSGQTGQFRSFGFLGDSISPVLLFPLVYFVLQKKLIWIAALIVALTFTGGKAALAMVMLVFPLLMLSKLPLILQYASIPCAFLVGFLFYPVLSELYAAFTQNDAVVYSWNSRQLSYAVGWDYFLQNPWTGVGVNQSLQTIMLDVQDLARFEGVKQYYPVHQIDNAFIRALGETGIFGFLMLVGASLVWIHRSIVALRGIVSGSIFRISKLRAAAVAALVWPILFVASYQTTGWFEHGHPQLAWLLVIGSIGIIAARTMRLEQSDAQNRSMARNTLGRPYSSGASRSSDHGNKRK